MDSQDRTVINELASSVGAIAQFYGDRYQFLKQYPSHHQVVSGLYYPGETSPGTVYKLFLRKLRAYQKEMDQITFEALTRRLDELVDQVTVEAESNPDGVSDLVSELVGWDNNDLFDAEPDRQGVYIVAGIEHYHLHKNGLIDIEIAGYAKHCDYLETSVPVCHQTRYLTLNPTITYMVVVHPPATFN